MESKINCDLCNKLYSDIKSHQRFKHSDKPTTSKCETCNKEYNRYYIKKHKCQNPLPQ